LERYDTPRHEKSERRHAANQKERTERISTLPPRSIEFPARQPKSLSSAFSACRKCGRRRGAGQVWRLCRCHQGELKIFVSVDVLHSDARTKQL
jgi:hypothetical protein